MQPLWTCLAMLLAWSSGVGLNAAGAAGYSILPVDVSNTGELRYSTPSLGERAVAYLRQVGPDQSIHVAALGVDNSGFLAGIQAPTLNTVNSGFLAGLGRPSVSDDGDVAFAGTETGGARGIYIVARGGGAPGTVEASLDPSTVYGDPAMASRTPLFNSVAYLRVTGGNQAILLIDLAIDNSGFLAGIQAPALNTVNSGFLAGIGSPAINRNGDIAFSATTTGGAESVNLDDAGVGVASAVIDNSGFLAGAGSPAINDHGTVGFRGLLDDSTEAILRVTSAGASELVIDNSGFLAGIGHPAINNLDLIGFLAGLDGGGEALFTVASPPSQIVATGDLLLGSPIVDLDFAQDGLNDAGMLAFWAQLEDGRQGIFLAAQVVPEASTCWVAAALVGFAAAATMRSRRRSRG